MISLYLTPETWAHRLPAVVKLLALAVGSALLFQVGSPWVFLAALAIVLGLYASLGRQGLSSLAFLKSFSALLAIVLAFHWLSGTFAEGVTIVLRLVVMILAANFVSLTTRLDDMLDSVMLLFKPLERFGISARKPALAIALVLRFTPHLLDVYGKLREAYHARTGRKGSWRLLPPFAIQALRMSDNVADALKARGGSGGLSR